MDFSSSDLMKVPACPFSEPKLVSCLLKSTEQYFDPLPITGFIYGTSAFHSSSA